MRKVIYFILFYFITTTLNATSLTFSSEEQKYINTKTVKVAVLPSFIPFSMSNDGKLEGLSHDIFTLIQQKTGIKMQFHVDTWDNNFDKFTNNEIDIIDSISYTKKRSSYISFTKPYHILQLALFSRKEFINY